MTILPPNYNQEIQQLRRKAFLLLERRVGHPLNSESEKKDVLKYSSPAEALENAKRILTEFKNLDMEQRNYEDLLQAGVEWCNDWLEAGGYKYLFSTLSYDELDWLVDFQEYWLDIFDVVPVKSPICPTLYDLSLYATVRFDVPQDFPNGARYYYAIDRALSVYNSSVSRCIPLKKAIQSATRGRFIRHAKRDGTWPAIKEEARQSRSAEIANREIFKEAARLQRVDHLSLEEALKKAHSSLSIITSVLLPLPTFFLLASLCMIVSNSPL